MSGVGRVDIRPSQGALDFEWRDLSVDIGGRTVVQAQSGSVVSGELFVILGPSGAGKTTLLSALCCDRAPSGGSILFKGRVLASASAPVARAVRSRILGQIGYVRQRDIFMESLTVFETLYFTARLRMPRTVSHEEKLRRVHELIATLGLEACAQTTIGSTMRRGVSGGELKRVNIANELLGLPAILACDEPTSGLDSACALSVMQQLKTHARTHQIALICSIHQPSSQIAKLFDTALLLAPGGRQTYLGAAANIKGYLAQHGYALPEEHTVADYTLDLLASQPDADKLLAIWQERELASHEKGVAPLVVVVTPAARDSETHARGAGFCEQTIVLMQRQIKQARGTLLARNEVLLSVLVGVITGTIWFGAAVPGADGLPPSKRALEGVIFYTLAHLSWWPLYAYLFSFGGEVAVLAKEKRSSSYSIEAYFLAKTLSEAFAELVCPSIYFVIAMPMVGFGAYQSVVLWVIGLLTYQASSGVGMLVSVVAPPADANMIASTTMTLVMNAGGYLIDSARIPAGLGWIPFVSYWYYSSAVCYEAVFGEASPSYSPLSFNLNFGITALFAFALRFCVYLGLKTSRKYEFA